MEILEHKIASETRRTARIRAREHEIILDVSNGRLDVWARRFLEIEPELLDFLDALTPQDVYYDIGASIGHFAIYAAMRAGCTLAFEPEAQNFATATFNHYLNAQKLENPLSILNIAVSDRNTLGRLNMTFYGAGEHTKSLDLTGGRQDGQQAAPTRPVVYQQTVVEMTLDHLVGFYGTPLPTQMKIDVDGAEMAVLKGGQKTLSSPGLRRVFIEFEQGEMSAQCRQILEGLGFALAQEFPVRRMSGGFYEGLTNCIFERK